MNKNDLKEIFYMFLCGALAGIILIAMLLLAIGSFWLPLHFIPDDTPGFLIVLLCTAISGIDVFILGLILSFFDK